MADYTELKRLAKALISANESYLADDCNIEKQNAFHDADDALQDALPPEAALALVAENERLKSKLEQARVIGRISCNFDAYEKVLEERDQLKAENEALLEGMAKIIRETRMGDPAFTTACEVVGELCGAAMGKGEQP